MQKTDKILRAINNIEAAIKDIKVNQDKNNPLKTVNSRDYSITMNRFHKIMSLLNELKFYEQVKIESIDEIRSIIHSIRHYVEEEEYNTIMTLAYTLYADLTRSLKKNDKRRLDIMMQEYNLILKPVKKYITCALLDENGKVRYGRAENNFKFLSQNYLKFKYVMKKVGRQGSLEEDDNDKSRLETVIYALKGIRKISEAEKYEEIISEVDQMIVKYQILLDKLTENKNPKFKEIKEEQKEEVNNQEDFYQEETIETETIQKKL